MEIKLYTTGCPMCNVLKTKLIQKNIQFDIIESESEIARLGFSTAPLLQVNEDIMTFNDAIKWLKKEVEHSHDFSHELAAETEI